MAINASNNPFPCGPNYENVPSSTPAFQIIYLGAGAYLNTAGNSTTAIEFAAHVNSVGFEITSGKLAVFNITVKRQEQGQTVMVKEQYLFENNNVSGAYGTGEANGEVAFNDFIWISSKTVTSITDDTEIIDLGNIGELTIYNYINALDPATISWEELEDGNAYLFLCQRSGINETYEYKGTLPKTVGSGNTELTVADFDILDFDGNSSTEGVIPTLEQTINQNPVATTPPQLKGGASFGWNNGTPLILNLLGGAAGVGNATIISVISGLIIQHAENINFQTKQLNHDVNSIVTYSDTDWNASTNNLSLANGDTKPIGFEARVSVPGTHDFGAGAIFFNTNDIVSKDRTGNYLKKVDNNQTGNAQPPVDEAYADITALIADQNDQIEDYFYRVDDASDDPNVPSGAAIYIYGGTEDGDLGDYFLVWQEIEANSSKILTASLSLDKSKTLDTTLAADADLTVPVEANSIYKIEMVLIMSADGVPDGQTQYVIPSGASGYRYRTHDSTNFAPASSITSIFIFVGKGTGVREMHCTKGILITDTAGNFSIAWAQDTANANPTTVHAGSYIKLTKLN